MKSHGPDRADKSESAQPLVLPLVLQTELMLMPPDTIVERHPGVLVIRSPRNPHYWWGNCLYFDAPPGPGDYVRWEEAFARHIRLAQPASRHATFSWSGSDMGETAPFVAQGYRTLASIALSSTRVASYRFLTSEAEVRTLSGSDWDDLLELMVAERDPQHPREAYAGYARQRIDEWRRRAQAGLGASFGAYVDGALVSTLGLFVEPAAPTGRMRLARFQEVLTAAPQRRRGLAGTLLARACALLAERHGPLQFVIVADANDTAQRLYRALGFALVEHHHGLEKGGY